MLHLQLQLHQLHLLRLRHLRAMLGTLPSRGLQALQEHRPSSSRSHPFTSTGQTRTASRRGSWLMQRRRAAGAAAVLL